MPKLKMNIKPFLSILAALLAVLPLRAQDRIIVTIPTAKEEAQYIYQLVQDIGFFEEHNYSVTLPQSLLIEKMKLKAKSNTLADGDHRELERFVRDSVYKKEDYKKGYQKIKENLGLINRMIEEIDPSGKTWTFKEFQQYQVNLTLYGPGGSYDPDLGSILLYATPQGGFKNYDNPANTIIHEIVHIGIEDPIIGKYQVPHALKERIVDTYVLLKFGKYLPNYKVQNMGDQRTDKVLQSVDDLEELDILVKKVLSEGQ